MKKEFFDHIFKLMSENGDIYLISCGLGWPRLTEFEKNFPNRFIQTEASEQTALDISVGLAYSGKIPVVYTITPFFLRGFETIRTYINHENLNVKLVGAGRNEDYKEDGFSHQAEDFPHILDSQENITQFYPSSLSTMRPYLDIMMKEKGPYFISIKR